MYATETSRPIFLLQDQKRTDSLFWFHLNVYLKLFPSSFCFQSIYTNFFLAFSLYHNAAKMLCLTFQKESVTVFFILIVGLLAVCWKITVLFSLLQCCYATKFSVDAQQTYCASVRVSIYSYAPELQRVLFKFQFLKFFLQYSKPTFLHGQQPMKANP